MFCSMHYDTHLAQMDFLLERYLREIFSSLFRTVIIDDDDVFESNQDLLSLNENDDSSFRHFEEV